MWDPAAGTPEQRKRVEELRQRFADNRLTQKHSSDELLRCAAAAAAAAAAAVCLLLLLACLQRGGRCCADMWAPGR